MPDPIEPTPEISQGASQEAKRERESADLTTASLADAGKTGVAEPNRSFARTDDAAEERAAPLLPGEEASGLRTDWDKVQASFVDEPRRAVEDADRLVATAIKRLAEIFADEKAKLEGQWDRGGEVSTEDLRQALRRCRSFFDRVLSV